MGFCEYASASPVHPGGAGFWQGKIPGFSGTWMLDSHTIAITAIREAEKSP
jgi:hypothetical protein